MIYFVHREFIRILFLLPKYFIYRGEQYFFLKAYLPSNTSPPLLPQELTNNCFVARIALLTFLV